MGRKSQTEERREQILDAFERVILRVGYSRASQRQIAQEAGINQPIIHHYFAGGDELLEALLKRIVQRYMSALDQFSQQETPSLPEIIQFLCSKEFHTVSENNKVFFSLLGQSGSNDPVQLKMTEVYRKFLAQLERQLTGANVDKADDVAYVIMCLMIGHDVAKLLGFGEDRNQVMVDELFALTGR